MRILATLALTAGLAWAQNYVQDVFPIWEKHCLGCHASGTTMGSLDLETWEGLQRGGNHGTIVVPGDLKASRLYTMLTGETKPAMPMDGNVLSAREIEVVRKWIASGAPPPSAAEITELQRRATGEQKPKVKLIVQRRNDRLRESIRRVGLVMPVGQALGPASFKLNNLRALLMKSIRREGLVRSGRNTPAPQPRT